MELTYNTQDNLNIQATLKKTLQEVEQVFLNATYTRQVKMYAIALQLEYYELLAQFTKLLPDLPEDFLQDVEKQLLKL